MKNFMMLDNKARRDESMDASLRLALMAKNDAILRRKMQEFVNDHLLPARVENCGTMLGREQDALQNALERILSKAALNFTRPDASTVPIDPRLTGEMPHCSSPVMSSGYEAAPTVPNGLPTIKSDYEAAPDPHHALPMPTPHGLPTIKPNPGGGNIFHHYRTVSIPVLSTSIPTPPTTNVYPSPTNGQGESELSKVFAWAGADAVRKLLELGKTGPTDKRRQNRQMSVEERACKALVERYGGVWTAREWAGRGAPFMEYGGADKKQ